MEVYFLSNKPRKMGIFKDVSHDGKNNFFYKFLTIFEKYMYLEVEPPLGEIEKVFC